MAVCAVNPGSGVVLSDMASLADACSGVVLLQPADVPPNILAMDAETGALVSAAVASVWLGAWCFKALIRTLRDSDSDS